MTETISILIVEDSAVVRHALRAMLKEVPGAQVVGEFDSAAPAIAHIRANPPSVVLLDIQLASGSGLEVLRAVGKDNKEVKFIVFTNYADPIYRQRCMEDGAHAFYDKKSGLLALQKALQQFVADALRH